MPAILMVSTRTMQPDPYHLQLHLLELALEDVPLEGRVAKAIQLLKPVGSRGGVEGSENTFESVFWLPS